MSSRKKRKLDADSPTAECFGEVVAELDLEISLRRRLAETIDSRITWALVLQESLQKGGNGATTSFTDAAFDAISAIERPLNVLFAREVSPKFAPAAPNDVQPSKLPRLPPKQKVTRNPKANFLYIRSADLEPPYDENHVQTYLLRCPTCLRKAFTSLQGLLNHARISHGMEWGTHDECVRACAVVDPELDTELGIEVGLGPSGILPGLRSLFKMAVGGHQPIDSMTEGDVDTDRRTGGKAEPPTGSSHLVRTLGLHEDTPALAPFLGKQAIRRGIKVWGNGDEVVDIDGLGHEKLQKIIPPTSPREREEENLPSKSQRIWRMYFSHRNDFDLDAAAKLYKAGPVADAEAEPHDVPSTTSHFGTEGNPRAPPAPDSSNFATETGSRFHFAARVILMDRSLWIPPEKRPQSKKVHTHKWMISVDAPSYSHHITTILKQLSVSSLSGPSEAPLTTSRPPFVVVGTADEPFLAKLELRFSGTPGPDGEVTDQTMVLEHWVELDLVKSATPVVGDEQVVDIELDKRTILLPMQKGYPPIKSNVWWSQSTETSQEVGTDKVKSTQEEGHFIRPHDAKPKKKPEDTSLAKDNYVETWCPTCGLGFDSHLMASAVNAELPLHPSSVMEGGVKSEDGQSQPETTGTFQNPCNIAPRATKLPLVNACSRIRPSPHAQAISAIQRIDTRFTRFQCSDFVAASDPRLTLAVHGVVRTLKLPTFASPSDQAITSYPLDELGTGKMEVEAHLAPHAILAIAAKQFMRSLAEGGLAVARRDKVASTGFPGPVKRRKRTEKEEQSTLALSVLTPAHILRSVISRAEGAQSRGSFLDVAVFECLARLGVPHTPKPWQWAVSAATQEPAQHPIVSVKTEEF
ncbi:hypothetical protein DXG03_001721 [Asterophora parasitica]|uniref:YEATS domain-containing protein n=1 Tax=Asterophora parasitica TaxID=117018 RepID=A0A9P7GAE1_9AGAR|nr:hypothetical protein DXG03_001721 [Asterophora parasitica]